jgi:hypothetical protein
MNLECLNTIITNNLSICIDLNDTRSWRYFTGFTLFSVTKWVGAVSDNINLMDFGLTAFDNGRTNIMWSGITLIPNNTLFSMERIGYNQVLNPSSGNTSGITATTKYDLYPITAITNSSAGNYFSLNGGYMQGFFKLKDYNYQLLPARYNNGITIETIVCIYPQSQGIFFMMGIRAEDKYNPFFSGETTTGGTPTDITKLSGVTSSEDNYLSAFKSVEVNKKAFKSWEDRKKREYEQSAQIDNVRSNAIAFLLTADKKLAYRYIDENGLIVENSSNTIITPTGFAIFSIVFTPSSIINDPAILDCAPRRTGKLSFYLNGRGIWTVNDFPEFYFKSLYNQREKQIGVPYSISWGGGSFGLKHSWHYDYQTYGLYNSQNSQYINNNFWIQNNPLPNQCETPASDNYLPGLSLSADSSTFIIKDICNPTIETPLTVMRVEFTGTTGTSYFIKFNQPISVLSNRDYEIDLSFFNSGFFNMYDENGYEVHNTVKILVYGGVDINIINETEYSYPLTMADILALENAGLYPFPDRDEYQYMRNGIMYYGATGIPVLDEQAYLYGISPGINVDNIIQGSLVTGENGWKPLKCVFRTTDNSGQQFVYIGLLIETSNAFNQNIPLFINNFKYKGADILVQDDRKNDLLIQENFDSSFIGGIQKLRVYTQSLTSQEILHNAIIESRLNPGLLIKADRGGRIINT